MAAVAENIYVCSIECIESKVAFVVDAIRLSDLLSCSCPNPDTRSWHKCSEFSFRQVGYREDENTKDYVGCGIWGSKILLAGGFPSKNPWSGPHSRVGPASKEVFVFETSDTSTTEIKRERFPDFGKGKSEPWLQEVAGKLYALPSKVSHLCGDNISFEVFDPAVRKWLVLPQPPFYGGKYYDYFAQFYSYAVLNNTLLVSTPNLPYIYSFDCSKPKSKWKITTSTFKGLPCPLPFHGKALTVVDDDDCLLFTYQIKNSSKPIVIYQMFNDDTLKIVETLGLPKFQLPYDLGAPFQYSFVNLGDRKVCLCMAFYMDPADCDWMPETESVYMRFFVVILEFSNKKDRDIHSDSKSTRDFIILSTRMFDGKPLSDLTKVNLLGCFVPRPASGLRCRHG